VSSHSCPDWPDLMQVAPELQFRHCTLGEVQLPPEAFVQLAGIAQDAVAICCDLESHVYNPGHTNPRIVAALHGTHWIALDELGGSRR
jgi:hypothetical protein